MARRVPAPASTTRAHSRRRRSASGGRRPAGACASVPAPPAPPPRRTVSQRQPQPSARTGAAVVPLRACDAPLLRALPSGRSLLIGCAILAAAAGLYALARVTPMFALNRIEVVGAPPSVAAHVQSALAPLKGTSLAALKGGKVDRRIADRTDAAPRPYDAGCRPTAPVALAPDHPVAV